MSGDNLLIATLGEIRDDMRDIEKAFGAHAHALSRAVRNADLNQQRTTSALEKLTDRIDGVGNIARENRQSIVDIRHEREMEARARAVQRAWMLGWGAAIGFIGTLAGGAITWLAAMPETTKSRIMAALQDWI